MNCPLHKYQFEEKNDICPACEKLNLVVIDCEVDKIDRAVTTMDQQGYSLEPASSGSHVILVFKKYI